MLATSSLVIALMAACASVPPSTDEAGVPIKIIAFNDFHGHLQAPQTALGGAAYLASAVRHLKAQNPQHAVVSAGEMVGASPLLSALFLDEPTIEVFNHLAIDFNAVGNHEFDKGRDELLRLQHGGCEKFTRRTPCQLDGRFVGASFKFLAANVFRADGPTLFPATGMKVFEGPGYRVKVAFIGMTLRNTPAMVSPDGVRGLRFADEAATANALIPGLKAQGADVIVVLLHQGGSTTAADGETSCAGLSGDIVPILEKLDPRIDVVVSGHTHRAYVCDYGSVNPARPFLLTSAGQYGTLVTDIDLRVDRVTGRVLKKSAHNIAVRAAAVTDGAAFAPDAGVDALIARYATAMGPVAGRAVGQLAGAVTRARAPSMEHALGNLIADSQLAATRAADQGGAQLALMNPGGVRADLRVPAGGGPVTYAQLFAVQPFGNTLVVKSFTGRQIRRLLEQQFQDPASPRVLFPSAGFSYAYDLARPVGERIRSMRLDGRPVEDDANFRVTMNSFLAEGGDRFSVFTEGTNVQVGATDIDALEDYLNARPGLASPRTDRVTRD